MPYTNYILSVKLQPYAGVFFSMDTVVKCKFNIGSQSLRFLTLNLSWTKPAVLNNIRVPRAHFDTMAAY